jgi:hypothetical protein
MTPGPFSALFRLTTLLTLGFALHGCSDDGGSDNGGSTPPSGGVQATYSSLWNSTFSSCGVNCHSPSAADGTENGPDLSSKASFYDNLVNKNVDNDYPAWAGVKSGDCNSINFITPGNAAESTVVTSLIESYSINQTSCTSSYNLHVVDRTTITDPAVQNALVTWVNNGAKND